MRYNYQLLKFIYILYIYITCTGIYVLSIPVHVVIFKINIRCFKCMTQPLLILDKTRGQGALLYGCPYQIALSCLCILFLLYGKWFPRHNFKNAIHCIWARNLVTEKKKSSISCICTLFLPWGVKIEFTFALWELISEIQGIISSAWLCQQS